MIHSKHHIKNEFRKLGMRDGGNLTSYVDFYNKVQHHTRHIPITSKTKVLGLGSGLAQTEVVFAKLTGANVTATDFNKVNIETAKKQVIPKLQGANEPQLFLENGLETTFPNDSFHIIISRNSGHFNVYPKDPRKAVSELSRLIKKHPHSRVILRIPSTTEPVENMKELRENSVDFGKLHKELMKYFDEDVPFYPETDKEKVGGKFVETEQRTYILRPKLRK